MIKVKVLPTDFGIPPKYSGYAEDYADFKISEAAHPTPQVPMTEADIALAMASVKDPMQWSHLKPQKVKALLIEYTRAIEAHHKIGVKP